LQVPLGNKTDATRGNREEHLIQIEPKKFVNRKKGKRRAGVLGDELGERKREAALA